MKYELKEANLDDAEILINYKLSSILEYDQNISDEEKNKIESYVRKNVPEEIHNYKMIVCQGRIVGTLGLISCDEGIILDEIFLERDYRGMGIGTDILKSVLKTHDYVTLWVYKTNNAVNLYKRLGFKVALEEEKRYKMEYRYEDK